MPRRAVPLGVKCGVARAGGARYHTGCGQDSSNPMTDLKLIALDAEDLQVVSANLQDAVIKIAEMAYLPRERRFAALLNRFDWVAAAAHPEGRRVLRRTRYMRRRSALRFERVLAARLMNIDLKAKSRVLSLLAIQFEAKAPPSGTITLVFAGGGAIQLDVECVEAELKDLGAVWQARAKPDHPSGGAPGSD